MILEIVQIGSLKEQALDFLTIVEIAPIDSSISSLEQGLGQELGLELGLELILIELIVLIVQQS
jgi:hypothetical protein